jgi:biopolymer transport protein ExbD
MAGGFEDDEEISSINVTPLVDITLVLLIIFMVTTSMISDQDGLGIDKPEAATGQQMEGTTVMVACKADGTTWIDNVQVEGDKALVERLREKLGEVPDSMGVVQCDEDAPVGTMVHIIDVLREAGIKKYAIATRKPQAAGS